MSERQIGLLKLFEHAAAHYKNPNILKVPFNWEDRGNENIAVKEYSMCYNKTQPSLKQFCGPDWVFYHWPSASIPSFESMKNQLIDLSTKPATLDKVGWFGNLYSPKPDVIEHKTRPFLKAIGDKYPQLFDIFHVAPINDVLNDKCHNYLSLLDLTKYKYLIDIGGNGYSGRLKFLMFTRRPILIVDRKYVEYFYDDLIPYVHYIPVKEDLSDLLVQTHWLHNNPSQANQIAENAFNYAVHNFTSEKLSSRIKEVYENLTKAAVNH